MEKNEQAYCILAKSIRMLFLKNPTKYYPFLAIQTPRDTLSYCSIQTISLTETLIYRLKRGVSMPIEIISRRPACSRDCQH